MKLLQVALDLFSTKEALRVLEQVGQYVDIIELGTPLMIAEGARVVREVKDKYPDKIIFADDHTISATIDLAREYGGKVLVDMCSVKDIAGRAREVAAMGPDYICVHVGYDIQATGVDPIEELRKLDGVDCRKAIAGGIKLSTFRAAVESPADVIISGGGIYNQPDMGQVAAQMRQIMDSYEKG